LMRPWNRYMPHKATFALDVLFMGLFM
jgi:hypothetical protein